jgi:hypothetical protein
MPSLLKLKELEYLTLNSQRVILIFCSWYDKMIVNITDQI